MASKCRSVYIGAYRELSKESESNDPIVTEFVWPGAWLRADGRTDGRGDVAYGGRPSHNRA